MKASQILYPIMFFVVIYFIYSNIRNNIKYKKENMEVLLLLKEDDRRVHFISSLLMAILIGATAILIFGLVNSKTYNSEDILIMGVLPVLMVALYIPLFKKTKITTLGIHKRSYLIRWEDQKPDAKNKAKVKILYYNINRDTSAELTFLKDDPQLEQFKELAKTYRNSKRKDKKSGR
jgi:phosphate/sulfate permease